MLKLQTIITESSLSRVWQHTNSDRPIAILTAFRNEYPYEENVQRNQALAGRIKQAGYGYFFLDGHWVENQGTANEVDVAEDSVFVIGEVGTDDKFEALIKSLGDKYNQDAVLVKTHGETKLIFSNGSVQSLGKLTLGGLGQAYTQLRNNKKSNTFVFESERNGKGYLWYVGEASKGRTK